MSFVNVWGDSFGGDEGETKIVADDIEVDMTLYPVTEVFPDQNVDIKITVNNKKEYNIKSSSNDPIKIKGNNK